MGERYKTHLQVLVKLVQHQTHAVHEAVHVCRLALVVRRALMRRQSSLERLKVLHPLHCKVVCLYIGFVEDEDEREFCFVQDAAQRS